MSSFPGLKIEDYIAWAHDIIVEGRSDANWSMNAAEKVGNIPSRKKFTKEQFAKLVEHFEPYREDVECWLSDFDEDSQSWRDYAPGVPIPENVQDLKAALGPATTDLVTAMKEALAKAGEFDSCMSVTVCNDSRTVELHLDTSIPTYSEWISGEDADICLLRCQETKRVVGARFPLLKNNLLVQHEGPIRINTGFRNRDRN